MEPLFELRYTKDPNKTDYSKEMYRRVFFNLPFFAIVAFVALTLLVSVIAYGFDTMACYLIFVVLFFIAVRIFTYLRAVKLMHKRYIEFYGDVISDVVVTVTSEAIRFSSSITEKDIELKFSSVKKTYRTKRMLLFLTEAKMIYNLRLDAFTKGTPEEFMLFLNSKGIKVKL